MGRRAPTIVPAAVALLALACGEPPRPIQRDSKPPATVPEADLRPAAVPSAAGPGGEMIPGLAIPVPIAEADPGSAEISRAALLADLARAFEEGRADDAAAIADVLIVLDAKDAEAIEQRARALDLQGDREGAGADRKRCCELGRASCCR